MIRANILQQLVVIIIIIIIIYYNYNIYSQAGAVAAAAEERKKSKYACLDQCHQFAPVAVETSGVFAPGTLQFLRELGQQLCQVSSDANACSYLIQHLSVAVQQ